MKEIIQDCDTSSQEYVLIMCLFYNSINDRWEGGTFLE